MNIRILYICLSIIFICNVSAAEKDKLYQNFIELTFNKSEYNELLDDQNYTCSNLLFKVGTIVKILKNEIKDYKKLDFYYFKLDLNKAIIKQVNSVVDIFSNLIQKFYSPRREIQNILNYSNYKSINTDIFRNNNTQSKYIISTNKEWEPMRLFLKRLLKISTYLEQTIKNFDQKLPRPLVTNVDYVISGKRKLLKKKCNVILIYKTFQTGAWIFKRLYQILNYDANSHFWKNRKSPSFGVINRRKINLNSENILNISQNTLTSKSKENVEMKYERRKRNTEDELNEEDTDNIVEQNNDADELNEDAIEENTANISKDTENGSDEKNNFSAAYEKIRQKLISDVIAAQEKHDQQLRKSMPRRINDNKNSKGNKDSKVSKDSIDDKLEDDKTNEANWTNSLNQTTDIIRNSKRKDGLQISKDKTKKKIDSKISETILKKSDNTKNNLEKYKTNEISTNSFVNSESNKNRVEQNKTEKANYLKEKYASQISSNSIKNSEYSESNFMEINSIEKDDSENSANSLEYSESSESNLEKDRIDWIKELESISEEEGSVKETPKLKINPRVSIKLKDTNSDSEISSKNKISDESDSEINNRRNYFNRKTVVSDKIQKKRMTPVEKYVSTSNTTKQKKKHKQTSNQIKMIQLHKQQK